MSTAITFDYWPPRPIANPALVENFLSIVNDKSVGFFSWTANSQVISDVEKIYQSFKHKKVFIHLGIGGSSLGPEMMVSALKKNNGTKFVFINNIDSDEIEQQLHGINPRDAVFYVVSKSGTTAETMAALSMMIRWGNFKADELKNNFVFCTDPNAGDLRQMSRDLAIPSLEVPSNIGGRFSALTAVGLFPALFAGLNIKELFVGAENMKKVMLLKSESNPLLAASEMLMNLKEQGVSQTVLMPYSSRLRNLSFWFVQLWAESLGKKKNKNGEVKNIGLTPLPAFGATDQHSQVQLFMEGPYDKCFILIRVKNRQHNYDLGSDLNYPSLKKLNGVSLNQLMDAEMIGTIKALQEEKRPHLILNLDQNSEESLGAMILFFESLTALMGYRLNIDPFDQPGVEAGKKYAWEHIKGS